MSDETPAADEPAATRHQGKTRPRPEPVEYVLVTGPAAGRRRAGFAFGARPQAIRRDALTDDDLAAIMMDPQLVVARETRDAEPGA